MSITERLLPADVRSSKPTGRGSRTSSLCVFCGRGEQDSPGHSAAVVDEGWEATVGMPSGADRAVRAVMKPAPNTGRGELKLRTYMIDKYHMCLCVAQLVSVLALFQAWFTPTLDTYRMLGLQNLPPLVFVCGALWYGTYLARHTAPWKPGGASFGHGTAMRELEAVADHTADAANPSIFQPQHLEVAIAADRTKPGFCLTPAFYSMWQVHFPLLRRNEFDVYVLTCTSLAFILPPMRARLGPRNLPLA